MLGIELGFSGSIGSVLSHLSSPCNKNLFKFIYLLCYLCGHVPVTSMWSVSVWKSEDSMGGLVLPSYHAGPMMAYDFNCSSQEGVADGFLSLNSVWSTEGLPC